MELSPQQDVYYIYTVSPTDYFIDTVTPSAIQLNKEKTMSIELDGPLYLGSNSMQQQVDQNTADIADLKQDVSDIESDIGNLSDLDTVDKSSVVNAINEALSVLDPTQTADYINNSKGLKSGEISTNSIILNVIKDYAHSTFDKSKFTVVGSPVITDDGIASGFSSGNYLSINTSSLVDVTDFTEEIEFTTGSDITTRQEIYGGSDYNSTVAFLLRTWTDGKFYLDARYADNSSFIYWSYTATANTNYKMKFEAKNGVFYWYVNGVEVNHKTINNPCQFFGATTYFGRSNNNTYPFLGSIDLKQFSITVDGVPYFSGNKTGIDTIKPDNYTVVGTPTISADGVASGFSNGSNYLTLPLSSLSIGNRNFKFYGNFTYYETTNDAFPVGYWQTTTGTFIVYTNGTQFNGEIALNIDGSTTHIPIGVVSLDVIANQKYDYVFEREGNTIKFNIKKSGDAWGTPETITISNDVVWQEQYLSYYMSGNGSIDLNAFKIYVDGDLVYQPCLKIPYTESKTGSKIVDAIYRDRVNDMAEQFGFANYYTLDEDNGNFTLPQVELYGLIGQRTLRDSYRNGINYWELYSNRDLEQGGGCTSGVEVTFARPFADTNYVLSVAYSAKSATTFTPTQTGDWIAKGKGAL